MQKFKTAIIVFLLLVVVAGAVGGYFLFLAPNSPTDEIPSGAITSGEQIGSGSISSGDDVPDVPEEPTEDQSLRVEIENFYLTEDNAKGFFVIFPVEKEQIVLQKMAEDGYVDIELVLKDFDTEVNCDVDTENIDVTVKGNEVHLRLSNFYGGFNFSVSFADVSNSDNQNFIAFMFGGVDFPIVIA
ncbi:MAG: hypothetical protein K2I46_06295 [Clostridia bacterium]|nr:hypothetical protein [Clostridia bacterium]